MSIDIDSTLRHGCSRMPNGAGTFSIASAEEVVVIHTHLLDENIFVINEIIPRGNFQNRTWRSWHIFSSLRIRIESGNTTSLTATWKCLTLGLLEKWETKFSAKVLLTIYDLLCTGSDPGFLERGGGSYV